jgi:hypothetical protein
MTKIKSIFKMTKTKSKLISMLFSAIILLNYAQAQSFLGAHFSTKDALIGSSLNPAIPAVSDVKWQVNLFGFGVNVGNNYFGINQLKGIAKNFDTETSLIEILDGKSKNARFNLGFNGPAVAFKVKNNAVNFGVRGRGVVAVDNMNEDLVYSLYHNFQDIFSWVSEMNSGRITGAVNAYHELFAGYSRTINLKEGHTLHAGINIKLITNVFNAQFNVNKLDFHKLLSSDGTDSIINAGNTEFDFRMSNNIDDGFKYKFGINGFGLDFGVVYELKKKGTDEHFLLAGLSFNDIGSNTYTLGKNSRTFIGNNTDIPAEQFLKPIEPEEPITDPDEIETEEVSIDEALDILGTKTTPTGKQKTKLPMVINAFVDIRVAKMLYVNANFQINPHSAKKGEPKAAMPTNITITPRFETRVFSAFVPVNWNKYTGFNFGAAIKLGHFTLGSSNILTAFIKKPLTGLDFYMNIGFGQVAKNKKTPKDKGSETLETEGITEPEAIQKKEVEVQDVEDVKKEEKVKKEKVKEEKVKEEKVKEEKVKKEKHKKMDE